MTLHEIVTFLTDERALEAWMQGAWGQGVVVVAVIVFIETGVVFMPFLPGDSLLFVTGAIVGASHRSPVQPFLLFVAAAVVGDGLNFTLARTAVGPWLVRRRWVRPSHLARTRQFFLRFGGSAITMGRFVPVVRTVAPFLAGLSDMPLRRFVAFNILGATAWVGLMLALGMSLGRLPWARSHLPMVSLAIVAASLVPVAIHVWRHRTP